MTPTSWQLKRIGTGRVTTEHARKYERTERERRYLLRELPPGLKTSDPHAQITDNYLTNTRLRLRKSRWPATNEWTLKLTQKYAPSPPDFSRTLITSIYLSEEEYEVLSVFEGNELRKNRHPYEHEGRKYSVDVFLGDLRGLVLAETDFDTDEEMDNFPPPPFAFRDVTNDELFTGGSLVHLSFDELRERLKQNAE
jgi:CYTH domain-containing protein